MALERIRREVEEQRARAEAQARKNREEAVRREQEYQHRLKFVLIYLQELEDYFWECAYEFSRLTGCSIKRTTRKKQGILSRLIGIPSPSVTLKYPYLMVDYEPLKFDYSGCKPHVCLSAHLEGLHFHAEYGCTSETHDGPVHHVEVAVHDLLSRDTYNDVAARAWLETKFEEYYHALMNYAKKLKSERAY
jgi:hypothetical protein